MIRQLEHIKAHCEDGEGLWHEAMKVCLGRPGVVKKIDKSDRTAIIEFDQSPEFAPLNRPLWFPFATLELMHPIPKHLCQSRSFSM